ncbi:MAG: SSU ribosomal protein S11p (S14e) [Microgenomates group bacterium GW2011_GWF1_38_5]|nr:MAG: SSU ribosomal protein S11p (S14e) [Microgenomates group bacterium GW2011_GWF1_38_5]
MVTKKITNKSEASPEEIKPKKETGSETSSSIAIKKIVHGQAHISASYNNTLLSITDDNGNMVAWSSAGSLCCYKDCRNHYGENQENGDF